MENQTIVETVNGQTLHLQTRAGVFSRKGLDGGTRLLLEHIKIPAAGSVADLGCGAGPIGIFVAKSETKVKVDLLDDHLRAVNLATANVQLNGVEKQATVILSDLFSAIGEKRYQQIISNVPAQLGKDFLWELVEASFDHLASGGKLWVVVVTNLRPPVQRFMTKIFGNCDVIVRGKHHTVLRADK